MNIIRVRWIVAIFVLVLVAAALATLTRWAFYADGKWVRCHKHRMEIMAIDIISIINSIVNMGNVANVSVIGEIEVMVSIYGIVMINYPSGVFQLL